MMFASDIDKNFGNIKSAMTFDLLVFDDETDYMCYVEAVHMLNHLGQKQACDFITDKEIYREGIYNVSFSDDNFLRMAIKSKEHFFVIDNTDYPEAILDKNWVMRPHTGDDSKDSLFVVVSAETSFTSNNKFYFWTLMFTILLSVLGGVLFIAIVCYIRKSYVLNRYKQERREQKMERIQEEDSSYKSFLMLESIKI